jgi:hypothetical protein
MKNIIEEITSLTNEWYRLIGPTHHKDRCCHWYIETKWSYGQPPKYIVQHHGYVLHDFEKIECSSYEEALIVLKDTLTEKIKEEKKSQKENEENGW